MQNFFAQRKMVIFMYDRRTKNASIFKDTEKMYRNHEILKMAINNSIEQQKEILNDDTVECKLAGERSGKVIVSGKRTLEASENYAKAGK